MCPFVSSHVKPCPHPKKAFTLRIKQAAVLNCRPSPFLDWIKSYIISNQSVYAHLRNLKASAESDAEINLSLTGDGYDVFSRAKRASELQCPGIVSCANAMAIATRDLVNLASRVDGDHPQENKPSLN
ncbi:hypothetical protein Peur_012975 [Populus x canadensis]